MLSLYSSGSNAHGQLANGTLEDAHIFQPCSFDSHPPNSLPKGAERVVMIAAGANHTLVLLEFNDKTRELWGSGDGRKGQLGRDIGTLAGGERSTVFRQIRLSLARAGLDGYRFKSIEATWETSYAVLERADSPDVLISFGSDEFGDLGVGGKVENGKDFHVVQFDHILPYDEAMKINSITSGQRHVAVSVQTPSSSVLVGWGMCRHGQLGQEGEGGGTFSSLPRIIFSDTSTSSALGIHHTIVYRDPDSVIGFGSNRKGQLQVVEAFATNSVHATVRDVQCTWNGSYLLVNTRGKWEIWSTGSNSHSQLGRASNNDVGPGVVEFPLDLNLDSQKITLSIACGSEHVLVLVSPSSAFIGAAPAPVVWGWGWNEHGNLGLGHTEDVSRPVQLWPSSNHGSRADVCGIWAGSGTSWICARMAEGLSGQNSS